jgi:hypothetical protein
MPSSFDLIVIGSRRRNASGRTYEIIKAIEPPVLVAIGTRERLSRMLLCSGGKHFIDDAVRLTGTLAAALVGYLGGRSAARNGNGKV